MSSESGSITIKDVRHVMNLLVGNLYGNDPHLTIRELVQNAHDGIVDLPREVPDRSKLISIRVCSLSSEPYIEIRDSGIGMSREEIKENFGKIGDSEKLTRALQNPELIGRFGIGFLSSFIVADRVVVVTRKYGTETTWRWETVNKQEWTLTEQSEPDLRNGTWIRLYFREHYEGMNAERISDLKTVDGMEAIIRAYCYLIPFPIQVGMSDQPGRRVNAVRSPWDDDTESMEAFKVLFGKNEPFHIHRFNESDSSKGYRARGVLFFRSQLTRVPSVQLYVKRMLVDLEDRFLVPPYGVFVSGLVDCPSLEVDLSRRKVSPFDPVYKWLRKTMLAEFEKGFLSMTQRRSEDFVQLWPNVDNSFIVHLTDAYRTKDDPVLESAATSFIRNAGSKLPFYLVDPISGSQGRPLWCTVEQAAENRRRELSNTNVSRLSTTPVDNEHPIDDRGRVRVYFTRSQQPVEKDILITKYGELLDVGRSEKAHEIVLSILQSMNAEFKEFILVEVTAAQFSQIDANEEGKWTQLRQHVQRGLVFSGRSHDTLIESFEPKDTPIVITDTKIDADQVKHLRNQVQGLQGGGELFDQLLGFLTRMEEKGGSLVIHVNSRNPLLVKLRDGLASEKQEVRQAATEGLGVIAWRAVIDYFGWTSTRDMIAKDRINTNQMISRILEANEEISALQFGKDKLDSELKELRQRVHEFDSHQSVTPQEKEVICGFVDMMDSTRLIMAHASTAPTQKWEAFRLLTEELEKQISEFGGTTVSFTGDGVLFVLDKTSTTPGNVMHRFNNLAGALDVVCSSNVKFRPLFAEAGIPVPRLRIGLSFGNVFFGCVGPTRNVIGLPVVEAARISAQRELFVEGKPQILLSSTAVNRGAQWNVWDATQFESVGTFVPKGLNHDLEVFRPRAK